jgi:hypothetical protein
MRMARPFFHSGFRQASGEGGKGFGVGRPGGARGVQMGLVLGPWRGRTFEFIWPLGDIGPAPLAAALVLRRVYRWAAPALASGGGETLRLSTTGWH